MNVPWHLMVVIGMPPVSTPMEVLNVCVMKVTKEMASSAKVCYMHLLY